MQDNMIDEEKARLEEAAQMTVEQKVVVLDQHVDVLSTRYSTLGTEGRRSRPTCGVWTYSTLVLILPLSKLGIYPLDLDSAV